MSFHPCENARTGTRGPSKSFVSYQRTGLALHPIKSGSLAPQPHSRIDALGRNEPKYRMVYRDTNRVYCNRHFFELGITTHLRVILRRFKKPCRRELHHAATDWKVIHMRVPSPAPSPPFKPPPCSPASGRTNHPPCACGRDQRLHNVWDVNACTANDLTKKVPVFDAGTGLSRRFSGLTERVSIYAYGLYDLARCSSGLDGLSLFECELLELDQVEQMLAMSPVLREGDACFKLRDVGVKASHSPRDEQQAKCANPQIVCHRHSCSLKPLLRRLAISRYCESLA